MEHIQEWPIFNQLRSDLFAHIQLAYVFGDRGDEVIIVTKYDNYFAYGTNKNGCLGFGHEQPVKRVSHVAELSMKHISYVISLNCQNMMALTKDSRVYSWGSNQYGLLGNGTSIDNLNPRLIEDLTDMDIIDVCLGFRHCLALTRSGVIFTWGQMVYSQDVSQNDSSDVSLQLYPLELIELNQHKIVAISCGGFHSLALTESGLVFSWGYNGCGQLGNYTCVKQGLPTQVKINEIEDSPGITKICCGQEHTLLLAEDGSVYSFGDNDFGQIGDGSKKARFNAVKLNFPAKVVDIMAIPRSSISLSLLENGVCFVWGVNDMVVPTATDYKTFSDAINFYQNTKVTIKPLQCD